MVYKLNKSHKAEEDIFGILDYMIETLDSISAARNFYKSLNACYNRLYKYPYMYPICRDELLASKGFRCAPVMKYVLFYKIDEEKNIVKIHRIVHGTMNYPEIQD